MLDVAGHPSLSGSGWGSGERVMWRGGGGCLLPFSSIIWGQRKVESQENYEQQGLLQST